jgi:ferritin
MLNPKIQDAFNKQLNAELYSSYLYISMAAYFDSKNLMGMSHWMKVQAQEEIGHALRFYNFINERGGRVLVTAIDGPGTEWDSPLKIFEEAYKHECKVTGLINDLVDLSIKEKDHAANTFLQWFVTEQVEEEASTQEVVEKIKLTADSSGALFILDKELSQRPIPPSPIAPGALATN